MTTLNELVFENTHTTVNLSLILATLWIINNGFTKYTTTPITIGQYSSNRKNRWYCNDLINEILKEAMIQPQINYFIEGEESETVEEDFTNSQEMHDEFDSKFIGRDKFIFILDSMVSYRNFELDLLNPKNYYYRSGAFLLIYTGVEPQRLNNVKEIFARLFNLYITNINVMIIIGNVPYLFTYFPFAKNKCHSSMPDCYISFRGIEKNYTDFLVKKEIYPSKVKNMYGCKLVVATWTFPPYVYVDKNETTGELKRLHGIEGLLISLLSELMNFQIVIKAPEPKSRGDIYPNGTATGAAKMIVNAEANITIMSFMYNKLRSKAMTPSYSYSAIPYVLAIPQGRQMTSFERLLKPFYYIIWSCFSSCLIFAIIFIYYIRFLAQSKLMNFIFGQGNRIPFTNLLSTLFGGPVLNNLPTRIFARYLLTLWLLYTFILRAAYSGALYTILQDGRMQTSFSGIREVAEENYTFYAYPATVRFLQNTIPDVYTGTVDEKNTNSKLLQRINSGKEKITLAILEYSVQLYNQINPQNRVDKVDEPLFTSQVVFFMPRHTYLKHHTNDLILRILASGLMKRFESYYLYSTAQTRLNQPEPMKLTIWLLVGLFTIYAALLLFTFVIFLLELLSLKSSWCKILVDFLNF